MTATPESIKRIFLEASELKDQARKSTEHLEVFDQAAQKFQLASELSAQLAESSEYDGDTVLQAKIYSKYYLHESSYCLCAAAYERRDIVEARTQYAQSKERLNDALRELDLALSEVSTECRQHLSNNRRTWQHYRLLNESQQHAIEARDAWDKEDFVTAMDHYREYLRRSPEIIEDATDPKLDLPYRRIATGNFYGMQANAAQAFAKLYSDKAENSILPNDLGVPFIQELFAAYSGGLEAFKSNPEWEQYRTVSNHVLKILKDFLAENRDSWRTFFIAFEDQPKFLALMKEIDMEKFKEIEAERNMRESKAMKLWKIGSFWLLVFTVVVGAVLLLATQIASWWQLLIAIVGVEITMLIVGALTLRSIGDLSEKGFLKLVEMALQQQFNFFSSKRLPSNEVQIDENNPS